MSSIDDRIVRMSFDNAKFEANASKTISTLDKLDEKLQFKGASDGTKNLQKSVNGLDFSSLEKSIQNIERRFSTMGIVGMNVINKITNAIAGSVKQLEAATIGQIKSGGWNRAMNIANAKFQIEGLGFEWSQIEQAVSYGVKDTAYGLDAAASAASQLAASGVDFQNTLESVNGQDLTAMHKSLRAISGVAAMTNSSYEDIARIFTTVAGNGRLMGDQLLQLSSRGMNAAAKLAEALGTTEADIRDMVSRGKIDFQTFAFAMDDAFGAHAKEANKTFSGSLGNMKAALSRVGEIFASPVINKTNTLFISITERIDELKNKLKSLKVSNTVEDIKRQYAGIEATATAYEQILKVNDERTITFGQHFAEMWESGIAAFSSMVKAIDLSWFDNIVIKVDSVTVKLKEFFDAVREYFGEEESETVEEVSKTADSLTMSAKEIQAAKDVIIKGLYGSGNTRKNALTEMFGEEGAKRVQDYIDKVVAAGWRFEEVDKQYGITADVVEDSVERQIGSLEDLKERYQDADLPGYALDAMLNAQQTQETIADSVEKSDKKIKNAGLFKVFDTIKASFSNLGRVATNIVKAITKIGGAIFKGFGNTFKMDSDSLTSGIVSVTESIANFTEKLIISDETAERITKVFSQIFSVVQSGIEILKHATGVAINFVKSLIETKTGSTIGDLFNRVVEAVKGFSIQVDPSKNPVILFLSSILKAIDDLVTGNGNLPSKLTLFLNSLIDSIISIKWGEIAKFGFLAYTIYNLAKLITAIKSLGNIIIGIMNLPANIGSFFWNLGKAAKRSADAMVITSIAKSIAIIMAAMIAISQISDSDLYKAIGTLIIIAVVIKSLSRVAATLGENTSTFRGIVSSASSLVTATKAVYSIATMFLSIAAAVLIIGVAATIIQKANASDSMLSIVGIFSAITLAVISVLKMVNTIHINRLVKITPVFGVLSILFISIGMSVLIMAGAMALLSSVSPDMFGFVAIMMTVMFSAMAVIIQLTKDVKSKNLLASSVAILAIGFAISSMFLSIASSLFIISKSVDKLSNSNADILTLVGVLSSVFLAVYALLSFVDKSKNEKSISGTLVSVSLLFVSIGGAILLISKSMKALASMTVENYGVAIATLSAIFITIIALIAISSEMKVQNILSVAGLFIAFGAAMMLLSGAVLVLSKAIAIMTATGAIFGDGGAMLKSVIAWIAIIVAISAAIALLVVSSGKTDKAASFMLSLGAAFIMVAGSLYVLALAFEKMASIDSNTFMSAGIAFSIFAAAIIVLATVGTFIPSFSESMAAIGDTFLKAGIGIALVGASFWLVAKAIEVLAPALKILSVGMSAFFTVLEEHKVTAIIVGVLIVAAIAAIIYAIHQLSPTLTAIAQTIKSVGESIGKVVSSIAGKAKGWFDTFSVRGKAAIVTIIATLCAAILQASPEMMKTIGLLIIKLLAYLGSIVGDIAEGLVVFLINLIEGLADAIMNHSAAIVAALFKVIYALADLVIQVLGQAIEALLKAFGIDLGDFISPEATRKRTEEVSAAIKQFADEQMEAARASDAAKQAITADFDEIEANAAECASGYATSFNGIKTSSDEATSSIGNLVGASKDYTSGSMGFNTLISQFTSAGYNADGAAKSVDSFTKSLSDLKTEYAGAELSGAALDAMLRAQESQFKANQKSAEQAKNEYVQSFSTINDYGGLDAEELLKNGSFDPASMADFGTESGNAYTTAAYDELRDKEGYKEATDEGADGIIDAMKEKSDEVRKATKEHIVDASQIEIRSSVHSYGQSAEHCIAGMVEAVKKDNTYAAAMRELAERGNKAFDEVNSINSPSKEYYQKGEYIVEGLVNGIAQNTELATGSMTTLSDAIMAAFTDSIDYCSKIASGELNYVPRIRPVVDSSSVDSSIKGIRGAFGSQGMDLNGYTGRLAADIGTLDRTNSDVVNELKQLRSDMLKMTDEITNMQMVMDTGALVGSISAPIDRSLGRRQVYKGRGN